MSSPISAHRTLIPSSIDPRGPPESWMGPSVPRSPSALVIIWTCDPDDIQVGRHTVTRENSRQSEKGHLMAALDGPPS
jgi:hypothetical protein